MTDVMTVVWEIIDFLMLPAVAVAVVICFLKRRAWFGWFGVFMTVTGIAISFGVIRDVGPETTGDWWWWVWRSQGVAVLILLIAVAVAPAKPGSWWDRRHLAETKTDSSPPTTAAVSTPSARSTTSGVVVLVIAGMATLLVAISVVWSLAAVDPGQEIVFTWPYIVAGGLIAVIGWIVGLRLLKANRHEG